MILLRTYILASDQLDAETVAHRFLTQLNRVVSFKVKLVQPYWKLQGQFEVLLVSDDNCPCSENTISDLVSLFDESPEMNSETEVMWSDLNDNCFLSGAKWVHIELI